MKDRAHEPEKLLESLLANQDPDHAAQRQQQPSQTIGAEDLDMLVDELESMLTQAKRVPFGRRLMVDESYALELVDRLRASMPIEIRQAHRVLEERERIIAEAQSEARRILHERGLIAELEVERERTIAEAEREAERIRGDADSYVGTVLNDLAERLTKIQASVRNGLETLQSSAADDRPTTNARQ